MNKIKLHLGCGKRKAKGFINIDIQKYDSVNIVSDILDLPFKNNSIDLIYTCSTIEHFDRKKWKNVLKYWYDLLKDDGELQLSTLNFDAICNRYKKYYNIEEIVGILLGGSKDFTDRHGMIFDYAILGHEMQNIGFKNVRKCDWKEFEPYVIDRDYDDFARAYLPHMDFDNGDLMMLNMIGVK